MSTESKNDTTIAQPKFPIGHPVKFLNDHDGLTGTVLSHTYHSKNVSKPDDENQYNGWEYEISARYYDQAENDMVQGVKRCKEEELVDQIDYLAKKKNANKKTEKKEESTDEKETAKK